MLGSHNIKAEEEGGILSVNTMMFFTHPAYNPSLLQNDIALIHLINPVQFTNKIRPVCLPSNADTEIAFEGQKVGKYYFSLTNFLSVKTLVAGHGMGKACRYCQRD